MKYAIPVCVSLFCSSVTFAQKVKTDLELLIQKDSLPGKATQNIRGRRNTPRKIQEVVLDFYKKNISSQIGANCIFEITCSQFSRQLSEEYGPLKGFFLSLDRISRCSKLSWMETFPFRINSDGKVCDDVEYYRVK